MLDVTAIPTDIWSLILPLACTDGGFTGKSLALTSTFFHAQASPFRFYSLAFDTLARMENFLAFVRRQPGDFRPQIAHLYISHSDHPNNRLQWSWRSVARMTEAQRRQYMRTIGEEKMDWTLNFQAAIDALLHLAAPNLLTLCIAGGCTPIVIRYSFPRLEELTGFNFLPDANVQSGSASGSAGVNDRNNNTRFPALKRAHIALGISRPVSSLILRPLLVATATLTHVRISNVAAMSRALAGALVPNVDANFFPEQPSPTSLFPPLVLPALRHVTIQNTSRGEHGAAIATSLESPTAAVQMHKFDTRDGETGRMYLIEDRQRLDSHWRDRLKEEWLDRMDGGRGCWVQSAEEEDTRWKNIQSTSVTVWRHGPRPTR
ncbi:hypothetical protein GY45DRAFT_1322624 [Cubamyces sp. BRFM 1775]|nr:hypothetical protein GY45DRAFT_1322624 [Cubamyces sp. BRFM 1775]